MDHNLGNFELLDRIQLNSGLSQKFACEYSEDGKLFILSETGVHVLSLQGSMDNVFPRFSFKNEHINLSDTNYYEYLEVNDFDNPGKYYEAVLDTRFGNSFSISKARSRPTFAMWSPRGIVEKTDCALAILTTLHNIEIYIKATDENEITSYVRVGNFCKDIIDYNRKVQNPTTKNFEEVKEQLKKNAPTTFTWSHVVLKDRKACCVLFVGHGDGSITAWRFIERKSNESHESRMEFLYRYKTEIQSITCLQWSCRKSDAGTLSVGDSDGRICAVSVSKLSTDKITFSEEVVFNKEVLETPVDKIVVIHYQNLTFITLVKQAYLLVYSIDDQGYVLQSNMKQLGNAHITGIVHYEKNILIVLTEYEGLRKVELKVEKGVVIITDTTLTFDFDSTQKRTHGLLFSPNKVFLGILAHPCKIKDTTKGKILTHFLVYNNMERKPLQVLWDMTATSLRDHWDCFETLRVASIQKKKFPWLGLEPNLNYDKLSLQKLKILRHVAKLSELVYPMIEHVNEYNIKAYILINYAVDIKLAVQRMTLLLNLYFSDKKLTLSQMRSLDLLNFFLKEMIMQDILVKANLGEIFIDEITNVMPVANELEYPPPIQCSWCGEPVIGSACIPYHIDSRCAISLMPIRILPGFKCPFCKCIVSKEISKECYPIFCPYCDVPMERKYSERKQKKDLESSKQTMETILNNPEDLIPSDCYGDCLKENVHFNDIEENVTEYVILSDNDDEEEREDSLKQLHSRLKDFLILSNDCSGGNQEEIVLHSKDGDNSSGEGKESEGEQGDSKNGISIAEDLDKPGCSKEREPEGIEGNDYIKMRSSSDDSDADGSHVQTEEDSDDESD